MPDARDPEKPTRTRTLVVVAMNDAGTAVVIHALAPTDDQNARMVSEVGRVLVETLGRTAIDKLERDATAGRELLRIVLNADGHVEVDLQLHFDDQREGQRLADELASAVMRTCGDDAFRAFTEWNFTPPTQAH